MFNPNYLELVKAQLTQFATQADFETVLTTAFGTKIDRTKIFQLRQQWLKGDFSLIPPIEVLTNGELGHANGGYAGAEDKIFVSSDFLSQNQNNSKAITGLLLEEFGHKIDRFFNGDVDSAGDEGDIFSRLVRGETLSAQTLAGLKAEDDTAVIIVDGRGVSIEQQWRQGTTGPDTLEGTDTTDFIFGDAGDDTLKGKAGDDYLQGDAGDDKLYGETGDDYLYGNEGEDYLDGGVGEDYLSGEDGNDDLYGGIDNDVLYGGAGSDYLDGGAGSDYIRAGTGDDRIRGIGSDYLDGEEGDDFLLINNSADTANTTIYSTYGMNAGTITGGASDATNFSNIESVSLWTGSGNDKIDITSLSNFVSNLFNSDNYVNAGAGDDTIDGASGYSRNILIGGAGKDKITSHGSGTNSLYGGAGNDSIVVGSGDDTVDGGDGNDSIIALYSGVKRLSGGAGNDYISANYANEYIYTAVRNDTIDGGDGIDTFLINNSSIFQDAVDTKINYTNAANGKITGGANNGTTFKNIESVNFTTSSGNDEIYVYAATGDSHINAGAGNNDIWTGYGNDTVYTYDGNSKIRTGEGNDTIQTIRGNNTIYAGGGNDDIMVGGSNDTIDAGTGNDTIRSGIAFARISMDGGDGKDKAILEGDYYGGNITIENTSATSGYVMGGSLHGTTFNNIELLSISTGSGYDIIDLSLSTGDNSVSTRENQDIIKTGSGNDSIDAGTGNDYIFALAGKDIIDGGGGKDGLYIGYSTIDNANTTILYTTTLNGTVAGGSSNGTTFKNIESIQAQTDSGNDKIDISAATADSLITAGEGNDTLIGGAGNDDLTGGTGNDTMTGGAGNDVYFVDSSSDIVTENANGGNDTIYSSAVNYTLVLNVEKLILSRSANATGNSGDNIISGDNSLVSGNYNNVINGGGGKDTLNGGTGSDTLNGGTGNDKLIGGFGSDRFLFNGGTAITGAVTVSSLLGKDSIADFAKRQDKIVLSKGTFTQITTAIGGLTTKDLEIFANDAAVLASKSSAAILYSYSTGNLFYNQNGKDPDVGANGGIFATVAGQPALAVTDFSVVA